MLSCNQDLINNCLTLVLYILQNFVVLGGNMPAGEKIIKKEEKGKGKDGKTGKNRRKTLFFAGKSRTTKSPPPVAVFFDPGKKLFSLGGGGFD